MKLALTTLFATLAFTSSSLADTFRVDPAGGPGVDFVDLIVAIDAVEPGDVLILGGNFTTYPAFTLSKGISLIAEEFALFPPGVAISGVPAGQTAALGRLFLEDLTVLSCAGTVIADVLNLAASSAPAGPGHEAIVVIEDSADVRLNQFGINPGNGSSRNGVLVRNSRLDVQGGAIDGASGGFGSGPGGYGMRVELHSTANVSFSRVRGGNGGFSGGSGAIAIEVDSTSELNVRGTEENEIFGGRGCPPAVAVAIGDGSFIGGSANISHRIEVEGGAHGCGGIDADAYSVAGDQLTIVNPAEPALFQGDGLLGGSPSYRVIDDEIGALAFLAVGLTPLAIESPLGTVLLDPIVILPMGPVSPITGLAELLLPGPLPISAGTPLLTQAGTFRADGIVRLTNGMAVMVPVP